MLIPTRQKIVLLGMMSKMPVAGVVWQYLHYLIGLRRLGYDVYYVEAHARTPSMFMDTPEDDGTRRAAAFISGVMDRFDFAGKWAYQALHDDGRCFGLGHTQLMALFHSADLVINLHGGTEPRPEHYATGRLVYLETDPVALQIELFENNQRSIDFLSPHCAFFTFGENYGQSDCLLPVSSRFHFKPTRQPIVFDLWHPLRAAPAETFTTIGNWEQPWREVHFRGEVYHWSKHHEFLKFIDLPHRTPQKFELALSSYSPSAKANLESRGWGVRHALDLSTQIDPYRHYIATSRGEFTVAKDQNVRLRSGWFSDRSATYLAAGRPVVTQQTGFERIFPTGGGLFGFQTLEEILAAIEAINSDYDRHCQRAADIARHFFNYDVVIGNLLKEVGMSPAAGG